MLGVRPGMRRAGITRRAAAFACLACAVAALTACTPSSSGQQPIKIGGAYIVEADGPSDVDAYLVIRNSCAANHLLRVTSSGGGTVVLRGPHIPASASDSSVRDLAIPAHSMVRLGPNGLHLVIIHSGHLIPGRNVTLTLVFSRGGRMQVAASVTNLLGRNG
jgi:copper(I)-binding protein